MAAIQVPATSIILRSFVMAVSHGCLQRVRARIGASARFARFGGRHRDRVADRAALTPFRGSSNIRLFAISLTKVKRFTMLGRFS
jgi:hypothetical protein